MGLYESSMAWPPSKHALTEPIQNLWGHAHSALTESLRACPQTLKSFKESTRGLPVQDLRCLKVSLQIFCKRTVGYPGVHPSRAY